MLEAIHTQRLAQRTDLGSPSRTPNSWPTAPVLYRTIRLLQTMLHLRSALRGLACGAFVALLAMPALPDRVITEDGRVLTPKKARKQEDGYLLEFESGKLHVPVEAGIREVEIEGDMSDYVPKNDEEREKLAQGYVRYRNRWMSKAAYQAELNREFEEARKRADEIEAHSDWHNAWEKETRHFLIRTNTSPELLEYYANLLEAYYDLMDNRVGIKPTPKYRRLKMTVNIYKSSEEFHKLSTARPGPSVLGYFWAADNTLNFYHDYQEPALSHWVALHECTHLLTFLIDQQYQPQIWLNEAVADYFGSARIEIDRRGKFHIEPGQLQTDRVLTVQNAIEEGKDTKLKDLFFIDRGSFDGFQYAHAWSFVYFLNEYQDGKYQKGFKSFFRDLYTLKKGIPYEVVPAGGMSGVGRRVKPEDIRDLLLKKIRVRDVDRLEQEWKEFIRSIPIESVSARLKRGLRSVRMGDFDDAIADLDAAIEGGTSDPRAWAARGRARFFRGDRAGAIEDLREAVRRDPLNAGFHYELSRLMVGRGTFFVGDGVSITSSGGGEKLDDAGAKRHAGLASELDPENDLFRRWFEQFE